MKGQYLIVKYIIFFAIGIILVILVYFAFLDISSRLGESLVKSQLRKTGEIIRGSIVNVFEKGETTNSTILYYLSIPTKLSGNMYTITAEDELGLPYSSILSLNSTQDPGLGVILTLYNFNISRKNIIYSTDGLIKIKYNNSLKEIELS
jgi:hypothetical protein